ncbi:MAG TPA: PilZ domain-containing protein [Acidobacteriaceae bacterium]|nr:PilZ domain-containing protein [Acidobacteriaceae bacterium]
MHKFHYRIPRYRVDFPVRLDIGGAAFHGQCREISQEGMCLEMQAAPATNDRGNASFRYESVSIEVSVSVARTESCSSILKFDFRSDKERTDVAHLVTLVATRSEPSGPALVK